MAREFPFRSNASATARGRKQRLGTGGLANADLTRGFRRGSGGGGGGGGGSNSFSAVLTEILRDRAVFDSGFHRGLSAATVALSGTTNAPDGAIIEVRLVDVQTGGALYTTAWAPFDVAAGGAFFGTLQVPRAPCWYRAEVRVQGSTAPAAQMANRFAAGHVWSIWEQSNWGRQVSDMPSNATSLYDAVTHEHDVQISYRGTLGVMVPVTEANKGTAPVTPAIVSFANAWSALRPGEKLAVVFNVMAGTGIIDTVSTTAEDPGGLRDWTEEVTLHDTAVSVGTQVGVAFVPGWFESQLGFLPAISDNWLPTMTGHNAAGAKVNYKTLWSSANLRRLPILISADGSTVDSAGNVYGGLYDMRYTKACFFGPHGYQNTNAVAASTYSAIGDMPLVTAANNADDMADCVSNAKAVWLAASHPDVLDYPGGNICAWRGAWANIGHMDGTDRDGRQRHGNFSLFLMAKAVGLHAYDVPKLDGRYDDPGGTYADFWITGRNITTERARRAAAGTLGSIPATNTGAGNAGGGAPHRTQVMGWSINKRPAGNAVILTASGHPVLPDGQTFCRVYPDSGTFNAQTEIIYGYGAAPGHMVWEDYDDRIYLDWLVCDVGQPHAVLAAIPVQMQQKSPLPSTLPAPDYFRVSGTTYMRSTSNATPPGTQAYFEINARFEASNRMEVLGLQSAYVIKETDGSIYIRDTSDHRATAPAGTCVPGVFKKLGFRVTTHTTTGLLEIVDVATSAVLATYSGPVDAFAAGRVSFFSQGGSGNPLCNATLEYARIWQNRADGAVNPSYEIAGIPAAPHYAVPYGALQFTASGPDAPIDGTL